MLSQWSGRSDLRLGLSGVCGVRQPDYTENLKRFQAAQSVLTAIPPRPERRGFSRRFE
jgi:hypothetical protein